MFMFDLETNGLLEMVSKLWCMTIIDTATNEVFAYDPTNVEQGVIKLMSHWKAGGHIGGHNVVDYDIPVLKKLYPQHVESVWTKDAEKRVVDTLIMSRLIYSNLETTDLGLMKNGTLPSRLYKKHSLEAWGYRLGGGDLAKGEYGKSEGAWEAYSEEMLDYNVQDVRVTIALYKKLCAAHYDARALELEHAVAFLMAKQERNGFPFDYAGAEKLEMELRAKAAVINDKLRETVPQLPDKVFVPKKDNAAKGYKAGVPFQKMKTFNPKSRQQIEYVIRNIYGYTPQDPELYAIPDGTEEPYDFSTLRLKIEEGTFEALKNDANAPEELREITGMLAEGLLLSKRLGQIADGKNAWLKLYNKKDNSLHGSVITNGCVSGRASHSNPNMAQIPAHGHPYGDECRALFGADYRNHWIQAGIDASGLELRCLAHYLYPYDHGDYAREILEGDIHTKNQEAAGLPTRNDAKRFIYGFLYGAGDAKIGKLVGGDAAAGKKIKKSFLQKIPAIKQLREAIQNALTETHHGQLLRWKRHYLKGLDGRLLYVRSPHSALNLLLQSAGAVVCKTWIVKTEERLLNRGLKHGWDGDFCYMAWIHDEIQVACRTQEIADVVIEEAQQAMRDAQAALKFRCQLDTEGKSGKTWADCH